MNETIDNVLIETMSFSGVHSNFYSQWHAFIEQFGKSHSGIYFLQRVDKQNNIHSISRLIGEDNQGILYIGKSTNLAHRLGILINLINRTSTTGKHSMGIRYQEIEAFKQHLKPESIKLRVFLCDNPRQLESKMLKEYLYRYGELPPLNNSN